MGPVQRMLKWALPAAKEGGKRLFARAVRLGWNIFFLQVSFGVGTKGVTGTGLLLHKSFHVSFVFGNALALLPAVIRGPVGSFIAMLNAPRVDTFFARLATLAAEAAERMTCATDLPKGLASPRGPEPATWPLWSMAAYRRTEALWLAARRLPPVTSNAAGQRARRAVRRRPVWKGSLPTCMALPRPLARRRRMRRWPRRPPCKATAPASGNLVRSVQGATARVPRLG